MKTIKTSELTGTALDWAVAQCEEHKWAKYNHALYNDLPLPPRPSEYLQDNDFDCGFTPSTDWEQGGEIIEREHIGTNFRCRGEWEAWDDKTIPAPRLRGPTPLIAAMRCYVQSRLGDVVEVLDELV
jgi:hypothetical protein